MPALPKGGRVPKLDDSVLAAGGELLSISADRQIHYSAKVGRQYSSGLCREMLDRPQQRALSLGGIAGALSFQGKQQPKVRLIDKIGARRQRQLALHRDIPAVFR